MTALEFWENVYIAAIRSGKSPVEAANSADMAMKQRHKAFPPGQLMEIAPCRDSSKSSSP